MAKLITKLIEPGSDEWVEVLNFADHDFYHLPCYQQLASSEGETPRAFWASNGSDLFLLPFQQRQLPHELTDGEVLYDAGSSYGYAGPIWSRGASSDFVAAAARQFADRLGDEKFVSAFLRLHTLLNDPNNLGGVGEIVNHGPSVYIDLTLTEEELWKQTRRGHKRDLKILNERGYTIVTDDWDRLDDFLTCYYDTMRRLEASSFYFFPKNYFEELRACLGDDRIHLCLVYLNGDIACAGLVTEMDGLCQYHLSATANAHLQDHPSKLMLHHLRMWLKNRGNRIYHVGGGVGALRDTLQLFKAGFSPLAADFYTWRIIPDRRRYEGLVNRHYEINSFEPAQVDGDLAFFPQYRNPMTGAE